MIEERDEYVERFGPSWRVALRLVGCVIFVVGAIVVPMPIALRACVVVFFGAGAIMFARVAASREVALRIDAAGVTLGGYPLRYAATTEHVPWSDVETVVLWHQRVNTVTLPYVGIQRRQNASRPSGNRVGDSISRGLVSHASPEVVRSSRLMRGWQLDPQRLAAAMDRFSPGTPLRNL